MFLPVTRRAIPGTSNWIPIMYISYDGTGVPMIASELEGRKGKQPDRKGKQPDGSSKTREMKLGCVFTQTTTDPEGFPIRDPETRGCPGRC